MAEQRSKPYPSISIADATSKLKNLHKNLGDSKAYHKDNFASGLGYKDSKNGAFLRTVAALTQYGLVKKDGNDYKLTDLARKILIPTTETAEDEAVKEAALTPKVFGQLYGRYEGQDLPTLLPNILVTDFGILDAAKNKVAAIFRQSMENVNILNGNFLGKVADENSDTDEQIDYDDAEDTHVIQGKDFATDNKISRDNMNRFEIILREGSKAGIYAPYGLTSEEKSRLKQLIDLM